MNGTGVGRDVGCLDGSAMSSLRAFYGTCRGGEDSFDGLLMIRLGGLYGNR